MAEYIPTFRQMQRDTRGLTARPYISRSDFMQAYDEARDQRIQVYDIPDYTNEEYGSQRFVFERSNVRTDWMDHGWYTPAWIKRYDQGQYGMLGANPDAVRLDEDLLGLRRQTGEWGYAGGGWNPANWWAGATGWLYGQGTEYAARNFERRDAVLEVVDSTFNFKTDGWVTAIDEEFGRDGDTVREVLQQNGFVGETDGIGANNANHYMFMIKKELRRISYEQHARKRAEAYEYLWKDRNQGDVGREMLMGIGSDWELGATLPIQIVGGWAGAGLKGLGYSAKGSAAWRSIAAGIKAGKYTKIEALNTLKLGMVLQLTDKAGKITTLTPQATQKLQAAGFVTKGFVRPRNALGQFTKGGVWQPIFPKASNLANLQKMGLTQRTLLNSMGIVGVSVGSTMDFLAFLKLNRTLGGVAYQALGGATWGGGYMARHNVWKQEQEIKRADFLHGEGTHDISFSIGELFGDIWTGAKYGSIFGGAAAILMPGGVGGHWAKELKKMKRAGQASPKSVWNMMQGKDISGNSLLDMGDLTSEATRSRAKQAIGHMLDRMTGRTGPKGKPSNWGAALLDEFLIESHHRSYIDLADFLFFIYKETGVWISESAADAVVKDFLKKGLQEAGGEFATNAQRLARRRAEAQRVRSSDPAGAPVSILDEPPPPARNYAAGNATAGDYAQVNKLRRLFQKARTKAIKERDKTGEVSPETLAEYNKARKAFEDFNERFPLAPEEMSPDVRFTNFDLGGTRAGQLLAKIIEAKRTLNQRSLQGAKQDEIASLTKKYNDAIADLDSEFPRHDKRSRADLDDAERLAEWRKLQADNPEAKKTKQMFVELLMQKLAEEPEGTKVANATLINNAMNDSKLGTFLSNIADLTMGNTNLVYSVLTELRTLARMLDNSHVFMADELANWGQRRSVWHAKRLAMRDAGHVISVVNAAEATLGRDTVQEVMRVIWRSIVADVPDESLDDFIIRGMKELSGETEAAAGAPSKRQLRKEAKKTELYVNLAREMRQQTRWFFGKYLDAGQETKFFQRITEAHRYMPLQVSDILHTDTLRQFGNKAWMVKVASYRKNGYVPAVELEAQGHLVLDLDEAGNIVGIADIPEDSIFWKESLRENPKQMATEVWAKINKMEMDQLLELQSMADKIARERGLSVSTKDDLGEHLIQPVAERPKVYDLDVVHRRVKRTTSSIHKALKNVEEAPNADKKQAALLDVANRAFILARQASEGLGLAGTTDELKTGLFFAYETLADLRAQGIEVVHYSGRTWSDELANVPWEHAQAVKIRDDFGPLMIVATSQPEIRVNGEIVQRARIVYDQNKVVRSVQTIKSPKDLEINPTEGDLISHSVESPAFEGSRPILREDGDDWIVDGGVRIPKTEAQVELPIELAYHDLTGNLAEEARRVGLNPDPIHTSSDFFVQGEQQIFQILEEIIDSPLTRRQLNITAEDLQRTGMSIVDIIGMVNSHPFIKNALYIAWQNNIDIKDIVHLLIKQQVDEATDINRVRVAAYVESLIPEKPLAHTAEAKAAAHAERLRLVKELRHQRETEVLNLLDLDKEPLWVNYRKQMDEVAEELKTATGSRRGNLQKEYRDLFDREQAARAQWYIDEGIDIPAEFKPTNGQVPVVEAMPDYLKQLDELGLRSDMAHLDTWRRNKIDEILIQSSEIKARMELENLNAIKEGSAPIHTRDNIYAAIEAEYEGLHLWKSTDLEGSLTDEGRWGARLRQEVDRVNAAKDEPEISTPAKAEDDINPVKTEDLDDMTGPEKVDPDNITSGTEAQVIQKARKNSRRQKITDTEIEKMANELGITVAQFKQNKEANIAKYRDAQLTKDFPNKLEDRRRNLTDSLLRLEESIYDGEGKLNIPPELKESWDHYLAIEENFVVQIQKLYSDALYIPRNRKNWDASYNTAVALIEKAKGLNIEQVREHYIYMLGRVNRRFIGMSSEAYKDELTTALTDRAALEASRDALDKQIAWHQKRIDGRKNKKGPRSDADQDEIKNLKKQRKSVTIRIGWVTRRQNLLEPLVESFQHPKRVLNAEEKALQQEVAAAIEEFKKVNNDMVKDPLIQQEINKLQNELTFVRGEMEKIVNKQAVADQANAYRLELARLDQLEKRFFMTDYMPGGQYLSDSAGIFHISHALDLDLTDARRGFSRASTAIEQQKAAARATEARLKELLVKFRGGQSRKSFLEGLEKDSPEYKQALKAYNAQQKDAMTVGEFMELLETQGLSDIPSSFAHTRRAQQRAGGAIDKERYMGVTGIFEDLYHIVQMHAEATNVVAGKKIQYNAARDAVTDMLMLALSPEKRIIVSRIFDMHRVKDAKGKWHWVGDEQWNKKGNRYAKRAEKLINELEGEPIADFDARHVREAILNLIMMKRVQQSNGTWVWRKRKPSEGLPKEGKFDSEVPLSRLITMAAREAQRRTRKPAYGNMFESFETDLRTSGGSTPNQVRSEAHELGVDVSYLFEKTDDAFGRARNSGSILGPVQEALKLEYNKHLQEFIDSELKVTNGMPLAEQAERTRRRAILTILTTNDGYRPYIMREAESVADLKFVDKNGKATRLDQDAYQATGRLFEPEMGPNGKPVINPNNIYFDHKGVKAGNTLVNKTALRKLLSETHNIEVSDYKLKGDLLFLEHLLNDVKQFIDWDQVTHNDEIIRTMLRLVPYGEDSTRRLGFFHKIDDVSLTIDEVYRTVVVRSDKGGTAIKPMRDHSVEIRRELNAAATRIDELVRKNSKWYERESKKLKVAISNEARKEEPSAAVIAELRQELNELGGRLPHREEIAKRKTEISNLRSRYAEAYLDYLNNVAARSSDPQRDISHRLSVVQKEINERGESIATIPESMNRTRFSAESTPDPISGQVRTVNLITGTYADIFLLPLEKKMLQQFRERTVGSFLPEEIAAKANPFEAGPRNSVERDILAFFNMLAPSESISKGNLLAEITGMDLSTGNPYTTTIEARLQELAVDLNLSRVERVQEWNKSGAHRTGRDSLLIARGNTKLLPTDGAKLISSLLQEWRKNGLVVYDKASKGWKLTEDGRKVANANQPRVIEKPKPISRRDDRIANTLYQTVDKDGFTEQMRFQRAHHVKMLRKARDAEDWTTWMYHDQKIRAIEAKAIKPNEKRALDLLRELYDTDAAIHQLKTSMEEVLPGLPKSERTEQLRKIIADGKKDLRKKMRHRETLIKELQTLLPESTGSRPQTHFWRDPSIWFKKPKKMPRVTAETEDKLLPKIFDKFDPATDINPNYRGRNSNQSIARNIEDSYEGRQVGYTEERISKLGRRTALQEAMFAWAQRMNGQMVGRNIGFEAVDAGAYRSGGEAHLGDRARTFDADDLAENPEFLDMFETDIRKIVSQYALTTGSEIQAQKVLNHWLEHMGVEVAGYGLKNIRFTDIFEYVRHRINTMSEIETTKGEKFLTPDQRNGLLNALDNAERVYLDMIGRPRITNDGATTTAIDTLTNMTQAIFGPGIAEAVMTVEMGMSVVAKIGSIHDLGNNLRTLLKHFWRMKGGKVDRTNLEGTAFVAENFQRSPLSKFNSLQRALYEDAWRARIRKIWSDMWELPPDSAQGVAMRTLERFENLFTLTGQRNFWSGVAQLGVEAGFLKQTINMVKNIAVGQAEYTILHNADRLFDFAEKLDVTYLKALTSPKERAKYVKGIMRETGVPFNLGMRWLRSGLVGDANGNNVNHILRELFEWGEFNAKTGHFDKAKMHKRFMEHEFPLGAMERSLYEDTIDRLMLFLEMQAHDISPEVRGIASFTGAQKNSFGRAFSFYATYPLAFFWTYMKKNPSEMTNIAALAMIAMISGFEMFFRQVRALKNGEDLEELAEKWAEHPFAMLMKEGSAAPWLGFGHSVLRDIAIVPATSQFTGDRVFKAQPFTPAPLSTAWKVGEAFSDAFAGKGVLTRRAGSSKKPPNFMDWIMTGTDLQNDDGDSTRASRLTGLLYEAILPTRAFWWWGVERAFMSYVQPSHSDRLAVLAGAYSPILTEMIENGDREAATELWSDVLMTLEETNPSALIKNESPPSRAKIPMSIRQPNRYRGPRRFADQQIQNTTKGVTADLFTTPQYIEVPLNLFN